MGADLAAAFANLMAQALTSQHPGHPRLEPADVEITTKDRATTYAHTAAQAETVYRRVGESLCTASSLPARALAARLVALHPETDTAALDPGCIAGSAASEAAVLGLVEQRPAVVSTRTPAFTQALRAYRTAVVAGDLPAADAPAGWLGGQPHVAGSAKRAAGIRGELDHFGAMGFLQGLLTVLRDVGHPGLLLVLDEVETLQRVRGDVRDKALNALRQLIDEVDSGRFPGLFLLITGTPAFYDGPSGVPRLPPLSVDHRRQAEQAFAEARDCVIVSTFDPGAGHRRR